MRLVAIAVAVAGGALAASGHHEDPFGLLAPEIRVTSAERSRLDAGDVIARALPADGGHLGAFTAARLDAPPSALVDWTSVIGSLKRGPFVKAVGRLSPVPVESDLDALVFEQGDLEALRRCRPGDCAVKLGAAEIEAMRAAIREAGQDWAEAATRTFKRLLVERVALHRAGGLTALPAYADRQRQASIHEAFAGIVARSPYLTRALPDLVPALEVPSHAAIPGSRSLYYWSHEHYGTGKPVVTLTHVRYWLADEGAAGPAAVAASAQIFASHYTNAALGLTMVLCADGEPPCYLAYVNRTHSDAFGGVFGGLKRAVARQRIESQAVAPMRAMRDRIQSPVPAP